jgi:hypothetical protein
VRFDQFNAQLQPKIEWPARFVVAHAYVDGLVREDGLRAAWAESVRRDLTRAEGLRGAAKQSVLRKLAQQLAQDAERAGDSKRVRALADVVRRLAEN